jgi:hypothetical protein
MTDRPHRARAAEQSRQLAGALPSCAIGHDFTYVTSMANSAGSHVTTARGLTNSIHDDTTKQSVQALVEAVGGAIDAINQLVEALK